MQLGYAIGPASCHKRRPMSETNAVSEEHRLHRVKMCPSLAGQQSTCPTFLLREGRKALSIAPRKLEHPDNRRLL
jgi:hypothetical protein